MEPECQNEQIPMHFRFGVPLRTLCEIPLECGHTVTLEVAFEPSENRPGSYSVIFRPIKFPQLPAVWFLKVESQLHSGRSPAFNITETFYFSAFYLVESQSIIDEKGIIDLAVSEYREPGLIYSSPPKAPTVSWDWLLDKENFPMVLLNTGEKEYKVPKNILAEQSAHFQRMFEGSSDVVRINPIYPVAFDRMIGYLMSGNPSELKMGTLDEDKELLYLALRFEVPMLQYLCQNHLKGRISVENALTLAQIATNIRQPEFTHFVNCFIRVNRRKIGQTEMGQSFLRLQWDKAVEAASDGIWPGCDESCDGQSFCGVIYEFFE